MATVFWDRKGVVPVKCMPKGYTINAEEYCNTLKELRRNVQNRRRWMLSRGVFLFQHGADFSGTVHFILTGNHQPPSLFIRSGTLGFSCVHWRSFWVENVIPTTTRSSRRRRSGWRGWRERFTRHGRIKACPPTTEISIILEGDYVEK